MFKAFLCVGAASSTSETAAVTERDSWKMKIICDAISKSFVQREREREREGDGWRENDRER